MGDNMKSNYGTGKQRDLYVLRRGLLEHGSMHVHQLAQAADMDTDGIDLLIHKLILNKETVREPYAVSKTSAASYQYAENICSFMTVGMYTRNGSDLLFLEVHNLAQEQIVSKAYFIHTLEPSVLRADISALLVKYPAIHVVVVGIPGAERNGDFLIMDYDIFDNPAFFTDMTKPYNIPVHFENDINAAVFGYSQNHHIRDNDCIAGLYVLRQHPCGSCICIGNKIYRGRHGLAGELKYLPIGIDWTILPLSEDEQLCMIGKLLISLLCTYDPSEVLIYCDQFEEAFLKDCLKQHMEASGLPFLPELIIKSDIQNDVAVGIRTLALDICKTILWNEGERI